MIVEFCVSNYRSIHEEQTLSFVAGKGNQELENHCLDTPEKKPQHLLKALAIYGPNASGKSNLLKALRAMIRYIRDSHRWDESDEINTDPFLLNAESRNAPSEFELTFFAPFEGRSVRFQYGFAVCKKQVHEEWLYAYPKGRAQTWLHRKIDDENPWEGAALTGPYRKVAQERTNNNTLFLSKAGGQEKHPKLTPVYTWLKDNLLFLDMGQNQDEIEAQAVKTFCEEPDFADLLRELVANTDTGIDNLLTDESKLEDEDVIAVLEKIPDEARASLVEKIRGQKMFGILSGHQGDDGVVNFPFFQRESLGTQRMLILAWALYEALKRGGLLVIDELEASLHPLLTRALLHFFHRLSDNIQPAQMIFSTHQSHLLNGGHLRRDQVCLVSKDRKGQTNVESLWDYKTRKGEAVERGYLAGRYGAIPYLEEVTWHGQKR